MIKVMTSSWVPGRHHKPWHTSIPVFYAVSENRTTVLSDMQQNIMFVMNKVSRKMRCVDSGHNGHKPKRPKPKRPQTEMATNRNGHKPKRPQTGTATDRKGHKPKRPQTETATNRNGHKPERPQSETATNRNRHNYILFSGLQICVFNRSFKLVSRSRQK